MAHFDPNDERLTAYILGDDSLSAEDRAAVAELLSTNPDARRFADELQAAVKRAARPFWIAANGLVVALGLVSAWLWWGNRTRSTPTSRPTGRQRRRTP